MLGNSINRWLTNIWKELNEPESFEILKKKQGDTNNLASRKEISGKGLEVDEIKRRWSNVT